MTSHASTGSIAREVGNSIASPFTDGPVSETDAYSEYRWDELNRLAEARRYDREGTGNWSLAARQRYRYDSANQRTVKQTLDVNHTVGTEADGLTTCTAPNTACSYERIALYVYGGDFERRGLYRVDDTNGLTYAHNDESETQYLVGGARMVRKVREEDPGVLDPNDRITVGITDLIQTTSAVIDLVSGALVETSTYYPNGARETYRAPDTENVAAEPYGFTGKEADEEVGLVYFGERYLIPRIGRWASPDPLSIHAAGGGEALNAYHYVSGNLLQARDPLGLEQPENTEAFTYVAPDGSDVHVATGPVVEGVRQGLPVNAISEPKYELTNTEDSTWSTSCDGPCQWEASAKEIAPSLAAGVAVGSVGAALGVGLALACPLCAVGAAAYGLYELGSNAGEIADSTGRLATGHGTPADYEGLGNVLGGMAATVSGGTPRLSLGTWASRLEAETLAAEAEALAVANAAPSPRGPSGNVYSVAFEMQLDAIDIGRSRSVHFNRANRALDAEMALDPEFAATIETLIPGTRAAVSSRGGRANPPEWMWHHDIRNGTMQLVPEAQHTPGSIFWGAMHPGGAGGYSLWAIPAGAPPN